MAEKLELIYVVVNPKQPNRVGLHEIHPEHPGGVAWVAGSEGAMEPMKPIQVALTPLVRQKLGIRDIVQVFPQGLTISGAPPVQNIAEQEQGVPPNPFLVEQPASEPERKAEQPAPIMSKKGKRF